MNERDHNCMGEDKVLVGVVLILAGLLGLLSQLHMIDISLWRDLIGLWPMSLVVLGFHFFLRRGRWWYVPTIGVAVLVLACALLGVPGEWRSRTVTARGTLEKGIVQAKMRFDIGTGTLTIRPGAIGLYDGVFRVQGEEPLQRVISQGNILRAEISQRQRRALRWLSPWADSWLVHLNGALLYDIEVEAGTAGMNLDLRRIQVRNLDIHSGASDILVLLGRRAGVTNVFVDAAASYVKFIVPRNIGVKLIVDGIFVNTDFGQMEMIRRGNEYLSPNYVESTSSVEIYVSASLAHVEVRYGDAA